MSKAAYLCDMSAQVHTFPIFYPLTVKASRIHGKGVYTGAAIPARKKIGSLGGAVITKREARRRAKQLESIAIVELWNGMAIDASVNGNELRYINHSCRPNAYMRTIGYHVEFYALRDIAPGEELSCNYGETHHDGQKRCTCGAPGCVGYI
ncbi:SET domain-containing protein-lysine N-methyltransferase [Nemorincola caseinilytica]|uniref:SET domain-containing protein-lysine N-methyltransferase n=1 Tax=Nemorincola caseinilytica TaxID=2054315 RepID=A0ABP8NC34_9BACT